MKKHLTTVLKAVKGVAMVLISVALQNGLQALSDKVDEKLKPKQPDGPSSNGVSSKRLTRKEKEKDGMST